MRRDGVAAPVTLSNATVNVGDKRSRDEDLFANILRQERAAATEGTRRR